jgi:hypothetical protein
MKERPILDSAAAKAKMRIENKWPPRSSKNKLKNIKFRLIASIISSIDIMIKISPVLLSIKPKTPKKKIATTKNKSEVIILSA